MDCRLSDLREYCASLGFPGNATKAAGSCAFSHPTWKDACFPSDAGGLALMVQMMRRSDTLPFVLIGIGLMPLLLGLDAVVLRALYRRVRRGQWPFIHQMTVVSFYIFLTLVCALHVLASPLDRTTAFTCVHYAILDIYMISDSLVWGSLYASAFILFGTSLLRLSVFLDRSEVFGLGLGSELGLAGAINFLGYGVGLGFGFLCESPEGVEATTAWAKARYPASIPEAFCLSTTEDTYSSDYARGYAAANGFCNRVIGNRISRPLVLSSYAAAASASLLIAIFLCARFGHKVLAMRQFESFGEETRMRLRQERIVVLVLSAEALIAVAQAAAAVLGNLCWHGSVKVDCDSLDLGVYSVVLVQLCASLPLFVCLSRRLRQDLIRALLPGCLVRRLLVGAEGSDNDTRRLVPSRAEEMIFDGGPVANEAADVQLPALGPSGDSDSIESTDFPSC